MAQWRKVVVSGSSAVLNQISASGDVVPISDAGSSLGSTTREWNNLYIDGTANIDSLVADTADINGGTVDNATIGANTHTTGKFTTVDATTDFTVGGTVITDGQIAEDGNLTMDVTGDLLLDVDGGDVIITDNAANLATINATKISGSLASTGSFGALTIKDGVTETLSPIITDGAGLGSGTNMWSDLFLATGGKIDFANGGITLTETSDVLVQAGGNLRVPRLEIDSAADYIDVSTDLKVIAAADIVLDPGGNNVLPGSNGADDLGASGTKWKDLYVAGTGSFGSLTNDGAVSVTHLTGSFSGAFAGTFDGADNLVDVSGTPSNNQIPTWTDANTLQGESNLTFDGTHLLVAGGGKYYVRDAGDEYVYSVSDGVLGLVAGSEIDLTATTIDINGLVDISGNLTVGGNLIVSGDTTTLSTTNLAVGDQFIFAATGSAGTNVDAGLIVQSGSLVDSGSALYHDIGSERWAVAKGISSVTTAVTPKQMVVTTAVSASSPHSSYGEYGVGEMWIETDTQDILIRTE